MTPDPPATPAAPGAQDGLAAIGADVAAALERASAVELVTSGRRTGRPHSVVLWFVYRSGAVYFLAHARAHGRGTDWYRNMAASGAATIVCGRHRLRVAPAPFPSGVDPHRFTVARFEAKYGVGTVDTWYDPALRIPIRTLIRA